MEQVLQKECPHCKRLLTVDNFFYKDKAHTTLSSWCKECHKESVLKTRQKSLDMYRIRDREKKSKYYRDKRSKVDEYKKAGCAMCGEKELVCLDFHHIDPSTKEFNIGKQFHIRSFKDIEKEIEKCVVLCANCHRKVHAGIIKL